METLVAPAWKAVTQGTLIKKFNFLPSLMSTVVLAGIATYQVAITWVMFFGETDLAFQWLAGFSKNVLFWESAAAGVLAFFLMEFLITVYEGGLLHLVRAFFRRDDSKYGYFRGMAAGLRTFLPLLEYDMFVKIFHPVSILTSYFLLLRVIGMAYFWVVTPLVALYALVALVINVFLSYARFYIVFEGKGIFQALSASVAMSLEHMDTTVRLFFSMLLVYVRTVLLLLGTLAFPLGVTALFAWLGAGVAFSWAFGFAGLAFLAFLVFVSHANSVLEIFVTALWYGAWEANGKGGVKRSAPDDFSEGEGGGKPAAGHPALA